MRLSTIGLLVVTCVAATGWATAASAGDCRTCTTSAECGADQFCVRWSVPTGCGAMAQICCPGQGCDTFSGRPSCEAAGTCSVVDGSDAGATGNDGGSLLDAGPRDAGGGGADAALPPPDGGGVAADAGGGTFGTRDDGGCGCTTAGAGRTPALALVALAVLGAVGLARRRRPRRACAR